MSAISDARVALVFGTDTGNTEDVGEKICEQFTGLGVAVEMVNIVDIDSQYFTNYDLILMGIPTWDFGGIQEDWEEREDIILDANLQGKQIALYGLGDQLGYGDYFLDAMGWLHERVLKVGAKMIGYWPTKGYDFEASLGCSEDKSYFFGLAIDEDQQFEQTDARVQAWVEQLTQEFEAAAAA
ncbi:flavodoxin [uncultured Pseudoteredinibacter sp.]|uniref:flavodoxin n=1 Tax=uncultured Pseudoteredinibacter sp. TaxID=1641701 RepID=UPI0026101992|nr:flavodoxin [uncultured Pseudoteredinibacter sp.]